MNLVHASRGLPELAGRTVNTLHHRNSRGQKSCIQAYKILWSCAPLLAGICQGRMVNPRDALVADLEMAGAQEHLGTDLCIKDSASVPHHRTMVTREG